VAVSASAELSGRVAVVTGASSGIGEQIARTLAAHGAAVALLARRADRLQAIVKDVTASGGRAASYPVDLADAAATTAVADEIARELGDAGIVVNNAGIMLPTPLGDLNPQDWSHQVELNIGAVNNTLIAFTEQLVRFASTAGVADLVNTASISGRGVFPTFSVYAASKAYVIHLGSNLRAELGPKNVRVTTIQPGIVGTELQSDIADENIRERLAATRDTVEWLTPEDVADVVAYAVSLPARVNLPEIPILPTRQTA
jgi:NADP-dependent 3-hydroxy acid dehydrogenase YdfG